MFLIYALSLHVHRQVHVADRTKYPIIGLWAKDKLRVISNGKPGEAYIWRLQISSLPLALFLILQVVYGNAFSDDSLKVKQFTI